MVDFRKLISPRTRAETLDLRQEREEAMSRDNAGLAAWIMSQARTLQDSGYFSTDQRYSYDEWGLYRVMPQIALRLDPTIELRDTEIAPESERKDNITWLVDAGPDRLIEACESLMQNGSYRRAMDPSAPDDVRRAASHFTLVSPREKPYAMGLRRLFPDLWPDMTPDAPDVRPPLAGLYVIVEGDHHDSVALYSEDALIAEKAFGVLSSAFTGEEIAEDDQPILRDMLRYKRDDWLKEADRISLQDFGGNALRMTEKERAPEPAM